MSDTALVAGGFGWDKCRLVMDILVEGKEDIHL